MEVVAGAKSLVETDTEIFNVVDPLAGVRFVCILTDWPGESARVNCCPPELEVVVNTVTGVVEHAPVDSVHVPLHVDHVSVFPVLKAVPVWVMLMLFIVKSPVFFRVKKLYDVQTGAAEKAMI